ncbi:MAG: Nramp family divalent metal transporter [Bryobacterales bacterium]|nr:Nramp family divalent metal transporter [Bryobacterales bacterium]
MSLPKWDLADLPEPPPFTVRNALRVIGPGAILLAASIGGGEWLIGPALAVRFGPGLFWIATLAIALQWVFNLEAIRYTLYTGEPVTAGFMRLRPGSKFWAGVYTLAALAQLGMPALGAACATVVFSMVAGRLPGGPDTATLAWITYAIVGCTFFILLLGGTIERMLELASWAMVTYIFGFLVIANVLFVPAAHWIKTGAGFFEFGYLPANTDMVLLATLAATAGSGGIGNVVISNWVRDKGFGMGSVVGAIPSALGGREVQLSHSGTVFPITPDNQRRWKLWWKYVSADQTLLWAGGCFIGMFLNINLATSIAPPGADLSDVGAGAFQAKYMAEHLWHGFWFLALLNGFWILFSTHLGNTDTLIRTVTDILWIAGFHRSKGAHVGRLYYTVLAAFTLWAVWAVNWGSAMTLFKALGVVAGPILAFAAVQVLIVNTTLLPPELRPSLWRRAGLVGCTLFYVVMFVAVLLR